MAAEPVKMVKVIYSVLCREGDEGAVRVMLEGAIADGAGTVVAFGDRCVAVDPEPEEVARYQAKMNAAVADMAFFEDELDDICREDRHMETLKPGDGLKEETPQGESDYAKYRGKCRQYSEQAVKDDPTLTLVRGYYYCPVWHVREPHWWTVRPDGTIHDPTRKQYPSAGAGVYEPFDGYFECEECGKRVLEEEGQVAGSYFVCSDTCYGRLVGVL